MKLEGVKVLDLSAFLPGPHMTMMMADHGADVIMVEPANGTGEPTRVLGETTKDGVSVWFRNIARGKRSLKLNLKDTDGRELLLKLVEAADVMIESFRPGVVKRLGVDYDAVAARNPKIIYCSISAFGQDSSLATKPAHDVAVQALAGLIDLNRGKTDQQPTLPNVPFADASASLMALSAILMALFRREATGEGDYIDIAMYDAAISWTPNVLGPTFGENRPPRPKEMRSFGGSALTNLYQTADGKFLAFAGPELKFATNLLSALGRPDLVEVAKVPPGPGQSELRVFFAETFKTKTLAEWKAFLEPIDCAWSWVRDLKEAFDDPHTKERGMIFQDECGNSHVGAPIKFMKEPAQPNPKVPEFGEHGEALALEAGLSFEAVARLKAADVI